MHSEIIHSPPRRSSTGIWKNTGWKRSFTTLGNYKHLGCFKDSGGSLIAYTIYPNIQISTYPNARAIKGGFVRLTPANTAIEKCYERAVSLGNRFFALQSNTNCFTHPDAGATFNRYGSGNGCKDGRGGAWQSDVYEIVSVVTKTTAKPLKTEEAIRGAVFVDAFKGLDNRTCGPFLSPCKTIETGLNRVENEGTLFLIGTHEIQRKIVINLSVVIKGMDSATIISTQPSVFAFEVVKAPVFGIHSVTFDKTRMLEVESEAEITIENCIVQGIMGAYPLITLKTTQKVDMQIINSSFANCSKAGYVLDNRDNSPRSSMQISNCTFFNTGGIFLKNIHIVNITKCVFDRSGRVSNGRGAVLLSSTKEITIQLSHFNNQNKEGQGGAIHVINWLNLAVVSCNFTNNTASLHGGAISTSKGGALNIRNCTFINNKAVANGGAVYTLEVKYFSAKMSHFVGNYAALNGGSIYVRSISTGKDPYFETIETDFVGNEAGMQGGGLAVKGRIFGLVDKCSFMKNKALKGGAVYIMASVRLMGKWRMVIQSSSFVDNRGYLLGQALFNYGNVDLHNITVKSDHMVSTSDFDVEGYKITIGGIKMQIGSMVGTVQTNMRYYGITAAARFMTLSKDIQVFCPVYFRVDFQSAVVPSYSMLSLQCHSCPPDKYTITAPILKLTNVTASFISHEQCYPCPLGGICEGDIKAIDNYWGTNVSLDQLQFWPCPGGYCCSSQTTKCVSWNTCRERREGVLCGSCKRGYVQSYVGGQCIPEIAECDTNYFILYFIVLSLIYTTVFTFMPSIVAGIKTVATVIFKRSKAGSGEEDGVRIMKRKKSTLTIISSTGENPPLPLGAFVTLLMFFYQIASLVHVDVMKMEDDGTENVDKSSNDRIDLREVMFAFANFKLAVSNTLCPMEKLTLLSKEFVNIGLKMFSIINLFFFLIFYGLWIGGKAALTRMIGLRANDQKDSQDINEKVESDTLKLAGTAKKLSISSTREDDLDQFCGEESNSYDEMPHLNVPSLLKIGLVKLVKLNFTSVSKFSFQMVHCVSIVGNFHLYIYGDYICYKWWQYMILIVVLPTLLTIPISFSKSLDLLMGGLISTNSFLLAIVFPAYGFLLYLKNKMVGLKKVKTGRQEQACIKAILEGEEYLFKTDGRRNDRKQNNKGRISKKFLRWPVVQLYRNILIVALNLFILTPIYRSIAFATVFAGFLAHDWYEKPYKHPYLNMLQLLSSGLLLFVTICNNPSSVSYLGNISEIPHTTSVIKGLRETELFMLAFVPFTLPLWLMWEKKGSKIKKHCHSMRSRFGSTQRKTSAR